MTFDLDLGTKKKKGLTTRNKTGNMKALILPAFQKLMAYLKVIVDKQANSQTARAQYIIVCMPLAWPSGPAFE